MRLYHVHWSDNHNQLGEVSCATSKDEKWGLPWVYLHAQSLKHAKARVAEFNKLLKPTNSLQPAHCPTALLAKYGFLTFPAGPLVEANPHYLA